jgi:hypothetical protein
MNEKVENFTRLLKEYFKAIDTRVLLPPGAAQVRIDAAWFAVVSEYRKAVEQREPPTPTVGELTPRQALASVMNEIDSGAINPNALVVCFRHNDNGSGFAASAPDVVTMIGLVETTKLLIHDSGKSWIHEAAR